MIISLFARNLLDKTYVRECGTGIKKFKNLDMNAFSQQIIFSGKLRAHIIYREAAPVCRGEDCR